MVTAAPQDPAPKPKRAPKAPKAPKERKPRAPRKGKAPAVVADAEAEAEAEAAPKPKAARKPRAVKPKAPRKPRGPPKSKEVKEAVPVYRGDFALPKVRGVYGVDPEDFQEQLEAVQYYVEEAEGNVSEDYNGKILVADAELQAAKAKARFQKQKQLRDLDLKYNWEIWKAEEEAFIATKVAKTKTARDKIDAAYQKKSEILDARRDRATKRIQKKYDTEKLEAAATKAKEEAEKQRVAEKLKIVGDRVRMKRELEASGKEYIHLLERADDLVRVHSNREATVEALDSDVEVVRDLTPPKPAAAPVKRNTKGPLYLEAPEVVEPPVTKRRVQVEEYIEEDDMTPAAPKSLPRPKPGAKKAAVKVRVAK